MAAAAAAGAEDEEPVGGFCQLEFPAEQRELIGEGVGLEPALDDVELASVCETAAGGFRACLRRPRAPTGIGVVDEEDPSVRFERLVDKLPEVRELCAWNVGEPESEEAHIEALLRFPVKEVCDDVVDVAVRALTVQGEGFGCRVDCGDSVRVLDELPGPDACACREFEAARAR